MFITFQNNVTIRKSSVVGYVLYTERTKTKMKIHARVYVAQGGPIFVIERAQLDMVDLPTFTEQEIAAGTDAEQLIKLEDEAIAAGIERLNKMLAE